MIINPELDGCKRDFNAFSSFLPPSVWILLKGHVELLHFKVSKGSPLIALKTV